jgi:ubiquinone/menaquinone biosynthesis C-methylase UbiE
MNPAPVPYDRLARVYRALEFLAFGGDLERARFCFLNRLANCRHILVLGEGDGRCLARLVEIAPAAQIHCLDLSTAMLTRARARLSAAAAARVTFEQADLLVHPLGRGRYDAVITFFFLDCFTTAQASTIVARVRESLQPGASWLFADFVVPARGFARLRAQTWVKLLYLFFRWQTDLEARALPPSEEIIERAGFDRADLRVLQSGLLHSAVYTTHGNSRLTAT